MKTRLFDEEGRTNVGAIDYDLDKLLRDFSKKIV